VQLFSASIDSQSLQACLNAVANEFPDYGTDVLEGLNKRLNGVPVTLGNFMKIVNDFDKTIERII